MHVTHESSPTTTSSSSPRRLSLQLYLDDRFAEGPRARPCALLGACPPPPSCSLRLTRMCVSSRARARSLFAVHLHVQKRLVKDSFARLLHIAWTCSAHAPSPTT